jgi:branched-subunit amino acid aminotransferase/4-amino-4-deoxychorismate lyase
LFFNITNVVSLIEWIWNIYACYLVADTAFGKGSLYIRPLLLGSGAILGLAPAPEVTFLIYVSPVGNYFKVGFYNAT